MTKTRRVSREVSAANADDAARVTVVNRLIYLQVPCTDGTSQARPGQGTAKQELAFLF